MGVVFPSVIAGRFTAPFAETVKNADSPKVVLPFWVHVARAFTCPKLAGILGRTHEPSGFTGTLRLSTETIQFWLSCPLNAPANTKTSPAHFPHTTPPLRQILIP